MPYIINLLTENWITALISGIILSWFVVYKLRGVVDLLRGLKPIKEEWPILMNNFNTLVKRVDDLVKRVDGIAGDITLLKDDITLLKTALPKGKLTESHSPLKLTEKGKQIANLVNADSIVDKYSDKIDLSQSTTAYAIQSACSEFALKKLPELLEQSETELIESVAFAQGLSKLLIFDSVFGILFRDKILKQKGIPLPSDDDTKTLVP